MDSVQQDRKIQTTCLLVIATILTAAALYWLRPVMLPFVLALFFTMALSPLVDLLMRRFRAPHAVALIATFVLGGLVLAALWMVVSASVGQLAESSGDYQDKLLELYEKAKTQLLFAAPDADPMVDVKPLSLLPDATIQGMLLGTANAIMDLLSQGLLVLIFIFFLLIGQRPTEDAEPDVWSEVEERIKRYVLTKLLTSATTGILVGGVLSLLGVDLALVFGLFAFLLNFIPNLGSIISTLLPLPVVLVSPEISTTTAVLAIAIPGAIQFGIGNVIEPKIMGRSMDLHPVVILMALILWGMIWGIVGMLLATPITAVMRIFFEKMEITAPVSDLLAGRVRGPPKAREAADAPR
jgi:AI-2 transport protein TqsA